MSQSSVIAATYHGEPQGNSGRKQSICHLAAIRLRPLLKVSPEEIQDVKTEYWPWIAEVHTKGLISVISDPCTFTDVEK